MVRFNKKLSSFYSLALIIILAILVGIYVYFQSSFIKEDSEISNTDFNQEVDSFEECAAKGYPVMESYPRQCRIPEGRNFTEIIEK